MRILSALFALLLTMSTMQATSQNLCDNNQVIVTLETGAWANEIDFTLLNEDGDSLFTFSSLGILLENNTVYTAVICLDDGCFSAEMIDSFGDGWNGAELTISYGDTMINLGGLLTGGYGQVAFGINTDGCETILPGCTDPEALNYEPWATEDDDSCEYGFSCETGLEAQMYVCTFSNGTEVSINVLDDEGNVVFSVENQTSAIVYYDLCLEEGVCYTVEMANSEDNNGWYGGYFWVNVDGIQILNDQLDPNSSFGVTTMSIDGSCPEYGCTDSDALNYDSEANEDDGSCEYPEDCDANAVFATTSGGIFPGEISWYLEDENGNVVLESPNSFDENNINLTYACLEDGCYVLTMLDNFGDGWNNGSVEFSIGGDVLAVGTIESGSQSFLTISINSECDELIGGCTDPDALNYNEDADFNDGSCEYPIFGCTDPAATNFSSWANTDDGSCVYPLDCEDGVLAQVYVCTFSNGENVSLQILDENGDVVFDASDLGNGQIAYFEACFDPEMCYTVEMSNTGDDTGWYGGYYWVNVDGVQISIDELDDNLSEETTNFSLGGGCPVLGCLDAEALNYNPDATEDDGSCEYPEECNENLVIVNMITGLWGEEVSWMIADANQNTVAFGSNYVSNSAYSSFACLEDGCFTLIMNDSFGDGWNGGLIEVIVNGNVEFIGALDQGSLEVATLSINSDDCAEIIYGCTDPNANNYNAEADYDDNSCTYTVLGCTDPEALNYNFWANEDDGSCEYPEECDFNSVQVNVFGGTFGGEISISVVNTDGDEVWNGNSYQSNGFSSEFICLEDGCYTVFMYDSFGDGWNQAYFEMLVDSNYVAGGTFETGDMSATTLSLNADDCDEITTGCTDPDALNYDANAEYDDGSCQYPVFGCTDQTAINFNFYATEDDGSCVYPIECEEGQVLAELYVCTFGNGGEVALEIVDENGDVVFEVSDLNNGQIAYFDLCLDPDMCYTVNMSNTAGNGGWNGGYYWINVGGEQINTDYLNEDATNESVTFSISGICPDEVVTGCTDPEALNYNANATEDDGSCFYPEPCDENNVLFTMQTGPWGNEINWQILNSDSAVVASGGNYPSNQVVLEDICLEDGCYTMEMFDSFGDGWNGAVIVLVIDEETAISFTLDSGSFGSMDFGVNSDCGETEDIFGCTDPEALNYNANATEDDGSCFYPEPCDENNVLFTMQTGPWGNEINWQILNSDSAVVASGGNYPSNQVVLEDICLEDGCYTMEMFDSFGDGWNEAVIVLVIDEETAISFTLDSGSFGSIDFGVNSDCGETEDIFGCTDPEALNYNWLATIDDGSCFYPGPFLGPSLALTGQDVDIEFNFAPNPVENVILLTFGKLNPTQRLTVDIYDAVGRLVVAEDFGKTQEFFNTNINLESLESGAYIIVASNGASKVTERLIKQ
jgi:hypothetical protein